MRSPAGRIASCASCAFLTLRTYVRASAGRYSAPYCSRIAVRAAQHELPAGLVAAVDTLQKRHAQRIFSTSPFGGYLLSRDIKAFIDGRAELFGEQFVLDYFDAVTGKDVDTLLRIFDKYQIDATLLTPDLPATRVMDHLAGWKRLYADSIAVVHVREPKTAETILPELRR